MSSIGMLISPACRRRWTRWSIRLARLWICEPNGSGYVGHRYTEAMINPFQWSKPVEPEEVIDPKAEMIKVAALAEEDNIARLVAPVVMARRPF
jgi:hypothetical protein